MLISGGGGDGGACCCACRARFCASSAGELRGDVDAEELANYCLHALAAAAELTTQGAIARLVGVTTAGLRPAKS
jgi:hypothetical protein